MRIFAIILFTTISLSIKGQFLDTFKVFLRSRPSIDARLESRYSFLNNNATKVSGVRLGLSFRRKLRVGIGYSWLDAKVSDKKIITNDYGKLITTDEFLKFGYVCYYADFVFHKTKRWQLSVPIQVGTGLYWTQYYDGEKTIKTKQRFLLFYEPGITVQFKITKWCGLGIDVCARLALKNTKYVGEKLNSFVLAPKLLIWFDQIFYSIAPKSKITKKYGPAYW
ncbi:MAG: hypothetical protein C0448_04220 [Sphingobacteriaceae bacterium]|nr:hypothetical protein [Sphingobacteriaceae bacterium]